ncbi:hypothetical protein DFW101_3573 [Solidesulfovibrio carbinoliphilus subsp. oakridgensis]|uniref:Uncharacterized protein n=1 Tax=Solidesulfovibrio carbinoliphilus subsp. oakridgensis TaxID=694327 RepID=G7Q5L0_9BACT|nr:hypothetical protein [Solidesulfovibrio carbinoliphilus]EHJ49569.1 hypothetical protein DFW101_3573 [Solidesulfovibrio carbinoliphilus subsp. oakridgensis]
MGQASRRGKIDTVAVHHLGTLQIKMSLAAVWVSRMAHEFEADPEITQLVGWMEPPFLACLRECGADSDQHIRPTVCRRAEREIRDFERIRMRHLGHPMDADGWAAWLVTLDAIVHDAIAEWAGGECWDELAKRFRSVTRIFLSKAKNPKQAEWKGALVYQQGAKELNW